MARRRGRSMFASHPVRHPVRNFFLGLISAVAGFVLIVAVINYGVSRTVSLDKLSVTVSNLPSDLENWSILVFSDLHGKEFGTAQSGISSAIGTQNVSCTVFAGDMVGEDGDISAMLELAALCPQDKPILYVPGDEDPNYLDEKAHSSLSAKAAWAEKLEAAGITILDRPVLYTRGKNGAARIWFVPADLYTLNLDAFSRIYETKRDTLRARASLTADEAAELRVAEYQIERVAEIRASVAEMQSGDIQIAVTHVPVTQLEMNGATAYDDRSTVFSLRQCALIIAGHYCAGQVRIPGAGAVYVPGFGWWPKDDVLTGLHRLTGVPQYISPGLGTSGIYEWWQSFRFMNHPTVTRITLTSKMV